MGKKMDLFYKSLFIHRILARRFGLDVILETRDMVRTSRMGYDTLSATDSGMFEKYHDYVRYRTFELMAEEIKRNVSEEVIEECAVAEAGVYRGDFSWIINKCFPDNVLYLYDTFEGFSEGDVSYELENEYTSEGYMNQVYNQYNDVSESANDKINDVKSKMFNKNYVIRKGYFPKSAEEENDKKFIFVSLDMDLYAPIKEGLLFFYPKLIGGCHVCS